MSSEAAKDITLPTGRASTFDNFGGVPLLEIVRREAGDNPVVADLLCAGLSSENPKDAVLKWRESYLNGEQNRAAQMVEGGERVSAH